VGYPYAIEYVLIKHNPALLFPHSPASYNIIPSPLAVEECALISHPLLPQGEEGMRGWEWGDLPYPLVGEALPWACIRESGVGSFLILRANESQAGYPFTAFASCGIVISHA